MFSKIKLGLEEWKRVEEELNRISSGEPLEIVINLSLVSAEGAEEEEEHHHHHVHDFEENDFTKEVSSLIEHVVNTYKSNVHPHLHAHHGSVMFTVKGDVKQVLKSLREVLEYVKTSCEKCVLHTVDGEFHIGEDLAGLYFGDAYKITVILPAADGRRLRVHEVHL